MKRTSILLLISIIVLISCERKSNFNQYASDSAGDVWITTGDGTELFNKHAGVLQFKGSGEHTDIIEVDTTVRFQVIDGFGFSLTGGSAYLMQEKLKEADRRQLMNELFLFDGKNIGVSYLRISIGASDLDDHVFSYNDLRAGESDLSLAQFSLREDKKHLIPVLKEIGKINPGIKIMGSPWSAPAWMKTNGSPKGGSLDRKYYDVYARYFVKYLQEMEKEGISLDAITIQNEPENPHNNPSMVMTAEEQADFIKNHLGPAFMNAGIKTKIVIFDHNCDHPEYPITVLNDPEANKYVDGSAFHLYLGEIDALSTVHDAHPDRHIYFTEQWTSSEGAFEGDLAWHVRNLIIGATRNWSRNVLEWNLASDPEYKPHTDDGGCTMCLGALTIGDSVVRNVSYYIVAHASKFVRPGSFRIQSTILEGLPNVAFLTPDRQRVLIVLNDTQQEKKFAIRFGEHIAETSLPKMSVGTFVW